MSVLLDLREASENGSRGFVPVKGIVMLYENTTPPITWTECDGTNSTPDLRGKFVAGFGSSLAGVSTLFGEAGQTNSTLVKSNLPLHTHTIQDSGAHTHSGTTDSVDNHNHTISFGTISGHTHAGTTSEAGTHIHTISISDDGFHTHAGTTDLAGDHTHGSNIGNAGDHTHANPKWGVDSSSISYSALVDSNSDYAYAASSAYSSTDNESLKPNGSHSHTTSIVDDDDHQHNFTAFADGGHNHTYTSTIKWASHNHTYTINNAGSHTHNYNSGSAGAHTHTASGSISNKHSHSLGSSGANWGGNIPQTAIETIPPFMLLKFIMRTS